MCGAAQHPEDTLRRRSPPNRQDDLPTINEHLLCGADENCRNPSRVAKQQNNYLRITLTTLVHWLGKRRGSEDVTRTYHLETSHFDMGPPSLVLLD